MFWADKIADEVTRRYQKQIDAGEPIVVRDEKTASGRVHVGSLRSASLHAIVADVLTLRGIKTKFYFEINDFDPMDGIPGYLDERVYKQYMGMPLYTIPSPEEGHDNFAELYGEEYTRVMRDIGFGPEIYRATELYKSGKMNNAIRQALDKRDLIRKIYWEISKSEKPNDWYPLNVVCENCGKISSTRITDFDGETVAYVCSSETIEWAEGCNHSGRISPYDGNAMFPWKVDWAAKFVVLGVHFEGGGKDHYSKGGARQVAEAVSREVFEYEPPYGVFNEFFLVGGRKMSSSKGNAATAAGMADLLPPHMLRLLLLKTPINRQINFDPEGDAIPVLFDTYDRLAEKYFNEEKDDETRLFALVHLPELRDQITDHYLPRFSQVAFLVQMPHMNIDEEVAAMKGSELTKEDKKELDMRSEYARKWLLEYADEQFIFKLQEELPESAEGLSDEQKEAMGLLAGRLGKIAVYDGQTLHTLLHEVREESGIAPKDFFSALYLIFLGRDSGPKAGWFLSTLDKTFVIKRLEEV